MLWSYLSSCQSTVGLYGTSPKYLRQPRFGHKVESIDLINNSGLERELLHTSYTRPFLIIQVKDKHIRSPNAQIYESNYQLTHQSIC